MNQFRSKYEVNFLSPKVKIIAWVSLVVSMLITGGIGYYLLCPAINIHSISFWMYIIAIVVISSLISVCIVACVQRPRLIEDTYSTPYKVSFGLVAVLVVGVIIMLICSASMFNAKKFRGRIDVREMTESDFVTDIPSTKDINKIALMDTDSAKVLGDRVLGSLSDVVSQFEMGKYYTMEIKGNVMKIAPLKYGGFFKWNSNKDKGIPGYVLVNPITFESEFVEVKDGINYAPSAYFGKDLIRHLRMKYPTKLFGEYTFQVDNEGNTYWVMTTMKTSTMLGCESPEGAIVCNAVTGECEYYKLKDIPEWVDMVFSGELVEELYDSYGRYVEGFINFSKKGITATTMDYGYLCVGSDIYIYTGITSVSADESNLGFILVNSRTGEYKYYPIAAAEEYSAMSAAEGAVQNYGYDASFPSLVNISGVPTYVMVLKDSNHLVKSYAMVNVKNYTVVAVENTLKDCLKSYGIALANAGTSGDIDVELDMITKTIVVSEVQFVTVSGNTIVYIKSEDGKVYKQAFSENEELILVKEGDKLEVSYAQENVITELQEVTIK